MTREDIIRMAREAGGTAVDHAILLTYHAIVLTYEEAQRFAELVAAAERERLNKKIAALESDVDHFFKLSGEYLERANKAEEAVALERERCAKMCEETTIAWTEQAYNNGCTDCAQRIRSLR